MQNKCENEERKQEPCKIRKHELQPPDEKKDSGENDDDFGPSQKHHGIRLVENQTRPPNDKPGAAPIELGEHAKASCRCKIYQDKIPFKCVRDRIGARNAAA